MLPISVVVYSQCKVYCCSAKMDRESFLRKGFLLEMFEDLYMVSKEVIETELKGNQMNGNCTDFDKTICTIQESLNPFSEQTPKDHLYKIGSRKAT